MKRRIDIIGFLTLAIVIISLTNPCYAFDENKKLVADKWFQEAKDAYNKGQCMKASEAANMALDLYTQGGFSLEALETTQLLGDIGRCNRDAGNTLYKAGIEAYNQKRYTDAIEKFETAKKRFAAIPDDELVKKCEDNIRDAEIAYDSAKDDKAKKIFENAQNLYESGDLLNAKRRAKEAFLIYNETGNENGKELCNALIVAVDRKIIDTRKTGEIAYIKAMDLYKSAVQQNKFENYVKAKEYANKAKNSYNKIGYKTGYNDAVELIKSCNTEIGKLENKYLQKATAEISEAKKAELLGSGTTDENKRTQYLNQAKQRYTAAKKIYEQLYGWASEIADNQKKKKYDSLIKSTQRSIESIEQIREGMKNVEKAENWYVEAQTLFTRGKCQNASTYANSAKKIFSKEKDQAAGVYKCETLISQIEDCLAAYKRAERFKNLSLTYYNKAQYANATAYVEKAINIYTKYKNTAKVTELNNIKKKIATGVKAKKNADNFMTQANSEFQKNNFRESIRLAEKAKTIYKRIKFAAGIKRANTLITKNQKLESKANEEAWRNMLITAAFIAGAILIAVITGFTKKRQQEKKEEEEMNRQKKAIEEQDRLEKAQKQLEEEARARELEEERKKLKAMISDEMRKMETEKRSEDL